MTFTIGLLITASGFFMFWDLDAHGYATTQYDDQNEALKTRKKLLLERQHSKMVCKGRE